MDRFLKFIAYLLVQIGLIILGSIPFLLYHYVTLPPKKGGLMEGILYFLWWPTFRSGQIGAVLIVLQGSWKMWRGFNSPSQNRGRRHLSLLK